MASAAFDRNIFSTSKYWIYSLHAYRLVSNQRTLYFVTKFLFAWFMIEAFSHPFKIENKIELELKGLFLAQGNRELVSKSHPLHSCGI